MADPGMAFARSAANRFEDATMRQFQSASGRTWSVDVSPLDRPANPNGEVDVSAKVLRFMSPGLSCDLREWPEDWDKLPQPELIQLLDKALTEWVSSPRN